jgi:hypothetical protein
MFSRVVSDEWWLLAPEGRRSLARGVSPWIPAPIKQPAPEGRQHCRPSGANTQMGTPLQGLTPLANDRRLSGAKTTYSPPGHT